MLEKALKRFWEEKFKFLIVVLLAAHFLLLDSVPAGFNHDEIEKIASIQSFISHGADISGTVLPKAVIATGTQGGQNNFPVILLSIFFRFIQINSFSARIPMVVMSLASALLLSKIVYITSKNKLFSRVVLLVSLLNPWMWLLSRNITEAPFTLFFVLLGIYLLERLSEQKRFLSAVPFMAAVLSYWGSLVVVPLLFLGSLLSRWSISNTAIKKTLWLPLLFFTFLIIVFGSSIILTPDSTYQTRRGELIFQNLGRYQKDVDTLRRQSISNHITPVFINKYSLALRDFTHRYISVLSPDFLFIKGDPRATYQFGSHGMFFIVDILFAILGIIYFSKRRKKESKSRLSRYVVLFILLGPLGSALNIVETSYVFRSILFLPGVLVLVGAGFCELYYYSKKIAFFAAFFYTVFFLQFLNFYFFNYSVAHQENQFWSEEVVASYISRIPAETKVTVVTGYPIQVAEKYLFYNAISFSPDNTNTLYSPAIRFGNISFTSECPQLAEGVLIIQDGVSCTPPSHTFLVVENNADSGSLWKIYNDSLCNKVTLTPFRGEQHFSDYRLYNEDTHTFCVSQVHKYD